MSTITSHHNRGRHRPVEPPRRRRRRHVYLALGASLSVIASMLSQTSTANAAATPFTLMSLTATVNGASVTAAATVSANPQTAASRYGVCARSDSGTNLDFSKLSNVTLTTAGMSVSRTQTFDSGVYSYFACVKVGSSWYDLGVGRSFTVGSSGTTTTPGLSPAGWTRVFTENFDTPAGYGQFPSSYSSKWTDYDGIWDTYGIVKVAPSKVETVHDGTLDMYLHTENGQPYGAAPQPLINGHFSGQLYGRYAVRFKSDPLAHFGPAWLLWPDSNDWNQGEIDFPEGGLSDVMHAYTHCIGDHPEKNCYYLNTGVHFSPGWHTAVIEWTRGQVKYILDGNVVGTSGSSPTVPMHWVLQTVSTGTKPDPSTKGHLLIDWVTIDKPA